MESSTYFTHSPGGVVIRDYLFLLTTFNNSAKIAVAIAILTVITNCIRNRYFHPLSHIPGPFLGSLSSLYHIINLLKKDEHLHHHKLHQKYGPLFRISPNQIVFNDPTLLPVVYHRRADKPAYYTEGPFEKGGWASIFNVRPWQQHVLARRRVAAPFNAAAVRKVNYMIVDKVDEWIEKLGEFADAGQPFDFGPWAQHLPFDVLSELCFGKPAGFIATGTDVLQLEQSIHDSFWLAALFARCPTLFRWMNKISLSDCYLFKPEDSRFGAILRWRDQLVEERLKNPTDKPDILNQVLAAKNPDDTPIAIEQVKAELLTFLIAGSDTTAIVIRNFIVEIIKNPAIYRKLQETDLAPSNLASATPSFDYLAACIKEVFRFKGAAPVMFPRIVSAGGITYNGVYIPAGAEMGANVYTVQRDPLLYGDDAEVFNPERFYQQSPERLVKLERYNFSWGYGARVCLGRPIAETQIYLAAKKFFTTFDVELMNPENPMTEQGFGIYQHGELQIKLKRRV